MNLYARVSLDESKPAGLQFVDLPKEWPANRPLEVRVKMRKRAATQAPIAKVVFFRGEPPTDEKVGIKKSDIIAFEDAPNPKKTEWSFILPPQAMPGPLVLSAQFTTQTSVKAVVSDTIALTAGAGKAAFKIKGKVIYGELAQPKIPVTLTDAKGKEKGTTTMTDDKGNFVFDNLPPGSYIVSSVFSGLNLEGRTTVEIKDADKTDVTIKLGLKRVK